MCADFFLTLTLFYPVYGSIIDFYYCSGAPEPTILLDDCTAVGVAFALFGAEISTATAHSTFTACNFLGLRYGSFRGNNFVGELFY